MATPTFGKEFMIPPEKADGFTKEMSRRVAPTLKRSFESKLKHEKDLKSLLQNALK